MHAPNLEIYAGGLLLRTVETTLEIWRGAEGGGPGALFTSSPPKAGLGHVSGSR